MPINISPHTGLRQGMDLVRGDRLIINPHHREAAAILALLFEKRLSDRDAPLIIGIGGESGSGKSELACALRDAMEAGGHNTLILQQDDFYVSPPKTNDRRRRQDPTWVGPREVRLEELDRVIGLIKSGATAVVCPLISYAEDAIGQRHVDVAGTEAVIVEGTYTGLLTQIDIRVFIDRTIEDTREHRLQRGREPQDEFLGRILRIEHEIVRTHRQRADIVVSRDFTIHEAKEAGV